jgi:hypothetical protein
MDIHDFTLDTLANQKNIAGHFLMAGYRRVHFQTFFFFFSLAPTNKITHT